MAYIGGWMVHVNLRSDLTLASTDRNGSCETSQTISECPKLLSKQNEYQKGISQTQARIDSENAKHRPG